MRAFVTVALVGCLACSSGSGGKASDAAGGGAGDVGATKDSAAVDTHGGGGGTDDGESTGDVGTAPEDTGGGSGGGFECPNAEGKAALDEFNKNYASGETGDCLKAHCDKEMTAAYGSAWKSGDVTGGACGGPNFYCACQCGTKDNACLGKCFQEHPDKNDAMACGGPAADFSTCLGKSCQSK